MLLKTPLSQETKYLENITEQLNVQMSSGKKKYIYILPSHQGEIAQGAKYLLLD